MRQDEIALQRLCVFWRDLHRGEFSKPGIDAINRLRAIGGGQDLLSGHGDRGARGRVEADGRSGSPDLLQLAQSDGTGRKGQHGIPPKIRMKFGASPIR